MRTVDSAPPAPVSPPPAKGAPDELPSRRTTVRDLLILLRERLAITLPVAAFIAFTWGYYRSGDTPLYQSTAVLQIERPERVVVTQEVVETSVNSDVELNTSLQLFSSATLRQRVLASLTPDERRRLLGPSRPDAPPAVEPDLGSLSVNALPRTLIIRINVTHREPAAAAFVANRFASEYMEHQLEGVARKNEQAVEYLQKRAQELLELANAAERRLQEYMRQHNLVSLDGSTNITAARLTVVSNALQSARLERLAIEEQCELVDRQQRDGRNLLEIGSIARHGSVNDLARQIDQLRREQSVLSENYLARHPKMVAIGNAIRVCQQQLDDALQLAIADLHATRTKLRETEQTLEAEFALQEKALFRLRDLAVEFKGLESSAQVAKASYAAILARLNETTTSKALGKIPVRRLDTAVPASHPVSPDLQRIVRSSLWLGITVLVALTAALVYFDDRIKSTYDIETILGETLVGIVAEIDATEDGERFRLVLDRQDTTKIEPFMALHATVGMLTRHAQPKALMLTSTLPGEGKTMVAANLAASFAYHGRKTLLVDCDLRRPMLHQRLRQNNDAGILTWFEAGAPLDPHVSEPLLGITALDPHLSLLTSGGRTTHPTPLFESPNFGALIAQLKRTFDVIVIDSPPLGAVSDALYIAKAADESLYICRFNRATRKHIRINLRALRATRCRVLGLVLNGLSLQRLAYYSDYRYYSSYDKYYAGKV